MRTLSKQVAVVGLLVLMGTATAADGAQEATPAAPERASDIGVIDAGSRTVWNLNDPTALVFQFTVLQFADSERAAASFRLITDAATGSIPSPNATPPVVPIVPGLNETPIDLADEAVLYYQPDESGAAGIATLFVLDGVYVQQWSTLPVPLPNNTLLVDPASLSDGLLALAEPWFAERHEGDAIAQVPSLAEFPNGYQVLSETSGLDSLQPVASPASGP
jgi:hypothetical protein